uniref:WD_REPEATS_REGION domain-containing protein n=3 Tax=Trichobilharzia regenti TaxID=157069 RepID=A0AA85KPT1_TRIRE|nr:unnamed protein product [Trichobilharzia regenti]
MPDVFIQNEGLSNMVKNLRSENADLRNSVIKLNEELRKTKNERDYHVIKHRQILQDKDKLHSDIRKVKEHYAEYEPILRLLRQKYETAMKEKTLHRIERDKAMNQVEGLRNALTSLQNLGIATNDPNDIGYVMADNYNTDNNINKQGKTQSSMKTLFTSDGLVYCNKLAKNSKRGRICDLPADRKVNPLLAKLANRPYKFTRLDNRKLEMSIYAHEATISKLAIHPIKSWLCSISDDKSWKLWKIPKLDCLMEYKLTTDWISSVDFHPTDEILATGNGKGSIQIWKIQLGEEESSQNNTKRIGLLRQHAGAVWSINWHWCGNYLASCGMDNTIRLWNVEYATLAYATMNKGLMNSYSCGSCCTILRGHSKSVNSVQFVPYGNILVTGSSDRTVSLWDGRTGLCEHTFLGHTHSINHAIFNQQGTYVISCDTGGFIRLWDLRKLNNFTFGINLPSVTKGTQLSTTANTTTNNNTHNSNNSINEDETKTLPTLFDLNKCSRKPDQSRRHRHNRTQIPGKQQHSEHQPHSDQQYQHRQQSNKVGVNQLVVDLSGEYILAACDDSKIYCIEISTSQISTLQGHEDSVQSIVLDYETNFLYSASNDQKICSWV